MGSWTRSLLLGATVLPSVAFAMPPGPQVLCDRYPASPLCATAPADCTTCHDVSGPPIRNLYGADIEAVLLPGEPRPLDDAEYAAALPAALAAVEAADSDVDGWSNLEEIDEGTLPGDPGSHPVGTAPCTSSNPVYDVCGWDAAYVYRNVHLDFCGYAPSADEMDGFRALSDAARLQAIDDALDVCMEGAFFRGRDGVLWQLGHRKFRPIASLQGLGYLDDYALWTWTQIDDHDAREVLLADYFVVMDENVSPPTYSIVADKGNQPMQTVRRAGILTSRWNMLYNVMFTAVPRTAAAQAYRSFLGWDIARMEGLFPIPGEPGDHDAKGVAASQCAVCHSTLDPLTYPFRNYNGFGGVGGQAATYVPDRLETIYAGEAPTIGNTPEAGFIMDQPVADLIEWAQVAANSQQFARATVLDYWKLLMGRPAAPEEGPVVDQLANDLMTEHQYSVRKMLHDLVRTEAYGEP